MPGDLKVERVVATSRALALIAELRAEYGAILFHQSGGCCDGSSPMCYPAGEFRLGQSDTLLGEVGGAPVYIGRAQGEAWGHIQLILDVVPGRGGMFSLDNGREVRFLTRGRSSARRSAPRCKWIKVRLSQADRRPSLECCVDNNTELASPRRRRMSMKRLLVAAVAAVLIVPGIATAADLSGSWKIALDVNGSAINVSCHFSQQGEALSGTCGAADGAPGDPVSLNGTVSGATAKWAYDIKFNDMPLHLDYTANVKSDTAMEGVVDAGQGTLPFTATKQ